MQARLAKDLPGRFARNEPISICIPRPEDLVVVLLFLLGEYPRYFGRLDRWVLEEGLELLLKRLLSLLKLGNTGRGERLERQYWFPDSRHSDNSPGTCWRA